MFETSAENWRDSSLLLPHETRRWPVVARIGFISDTHGRADRARRAIDLLVARGAERIVHLGDVGSESVLDLLVGIPALVVFGNCDDPRNLGRYAEILGIDVVHPSSILEFPTKPQGVGLEKVRASSSETLRVGITHGHLESEVERLLNARVDVLLHGHTHETRDECIDGVRFLNPGALHRAKSHTVLLFETTTTHASWLDVDREAPHAS